MGTRRVNAVLLFAAVALACTELPDAPIEDRDIATIRFVTTQSILAVGQSATFVVEARNEEGLPIASPDILWRSSSSGVAVVSGNGASACVAARAPGSSTITASDSRGGIRAQTSIQVLPCTRGPCSSTC